MALNRRQLLLGLSGLGLACSATTRDLVDTRNLKLGPAPPGDPSLPTILVCMPATSQTQEVWTGLRDELGRDYRLVAVTIEHASEVAKIGEAIGRYRPRGLVLMNNPTTTAYRNYQL